MSLTPADRAAFLEIFADLGPEGDGSHAVALLSPLREPAMAELGDRPGMDQVRAGVLRTLPFMGGLEDAHRDAAIAAIEGYAEDVAEPDPAVLLERAPAWVGLAYLEALGEQGWTTEAARTAADHARIGFAAARLEGVGTGEVLWALAEAAGDVGWTDRERFLLDEARGASFEDIERAGEVALLYALRCLQDGDAEGVTLLEAVASLDTAAPRTRIHARAVRGAIAEESDEPAAAREWYVAARAEVDAEEEPDVAAQLDAAIAAF
ncbi:MAG: hypothetical protein KC912_17320 [Proteobacteria bacterium]|nr:hypothetical protein [Pseudomonadota bacterium]